MKEEKYYIYDYETGTPIQVTKEQKEKHMHSMYLLWVQAQPKLDSVKGTILLVGTGRDFDKGELPWMDYQEVKALDKFRQGLNTYFIPSEIVKRFEDETSTEIKS